MSSEQEIRSQIAQFQAILSGEEDLTEAEKNQVESAIQALNQELGALRRTTTSPVCGLNVTFEHETQLLSNFTGWRPSDGHNF
jgi:hypothetical protein